MIERLKESGQFSTRDEAIADALKHIEAGEGITVHEDACEMMFDRPCTCTPTIYHNMPEQSS